MLNTTNLIEKIKLYTGDIPPIVIPSYGRPDSKLIKRCAEEGVLTYVFVKEDQIENYKSQLNNVPDSLNFIPSIEGIIPKRNFINKKMNELGYKNIIVMDDDITLFSYLIPGQTKEGKYKAAKVGIDLLTVQKVFGYYANMFPNYGMMGMSHDASSHFIDLNSIEEITEFGMIMQVVMINTDNVKKYSLEYKADGWDDFDFMLQNINFGLYIYKIQWLTEASPSIIKASSVCYGDEQLQKFNKYLDNSIKLNSKWGDRYVKLQMVRDFPNNRFNWNNIKEDFYSRGNISSYEKNDKIDYIVVGAGLSGCTFARKMAEVGKKILVIEKNKKIGGLCKDKKYSDYYVHEFGPHIFHTDYEDVYLFLSNFTNFTNYKHRVMADIDYGAVELVDGEQYVKFPVNINDWNLSEAEKLTLPNVKEISLKELNDLGFGNIVNNIYVNVIENYSYKMWGKLVTLDDLAVNRIKVKLIKNDDSYFVDKYQGMPDKGYSNMMKKMLDHENINLLVGKDFNEFIVNIGGKRIICPFIDKFDCSSAKIVYTGCVDDMCDETLPYVRTKFDFYESDRNFPTAVVNYPNKYKFTRTTDFRQFYDSKDASGIFVNEYPRDETGERCYVVSDHYFYYDAISKSINKEFDDRFYFLGRFGEYKYYDMDDSVKSAIDLANKLRDA